MRALRPSTAWLAIAVASPAAASFLSGDALDTMADYVAIGALCIVPIAAIVLFWLIHIMPEKIAHKRHHPQQDAIKTLCLLSLAFGGLLWPIAWLWAYTKPVGYRMAYGTEKHDNYFIEMGDKARAGELVQADLRHLRDELDQMQARGQLSPQLKSLRDELATLATPDAAPAEPGSRGPAGGGAA